MKWWNYVSVNRRCGFVEEVKGKEEAKALWFGIYKENMTVF